MAKKAVHYINQFFAGIGGEEFATHPAEVRDGVVGPGQGLQKELGSDVEIVATIICGDSYFAENMDKATEEVLGFVKKYNPDIFIAGPAFNAGRYGTACGTVCNAVKENLNIPVITAMYEENPGCDMFRTNMHIVETSNNAAGMRKALPALGKLAAKLATGAKIGTASEEGYFNRGNSRKNYFADKIGAERAVDMLVAKLNNKKFDTEYPMPKFDRVEPGKAITNMAGARIALVTSGGVVPAGNPDHIEASSASKYGTYDISKVTDLKEGEYETAHGGYDPVACNADSDRVLPVDVLNDMLKEGKIGSIHPNFYTTTGNGTAVKSSLQFGREIGEKLLADKVDAVILTST